MSKKVKLRQITHLQPGVYIRDHKDHDSQTGYLLSLRDFDDHLSYTGTATPVNLAKVKEKYILAGKDLLFSTRQRFNAFLLPDVDQRPYIASNSFVIIRPDPGRIRTDYLWWYLNHPSTQKRLLYLAQGQSQVNYISVDELGEVEIHLPPVERQKQIAGLYLLRRREEELTKMINAKKELYLQSRLLKYSKS